MKKIPKFDATIFFFAFFVVLFGLFSKLTFKKGPSIQPTPPSPQQKNTTILPKLNYNLPIFCNYQTKK